MDRSVTVRYFRIEVAHGARTFSQAVDAAFGLGASPHLRERTVRTVARVRLETRTRRRNLLLGEVVRVQTENIPPEAQQGGLVPLAIGGLGHSVAFCFDEQSSVIAVQFDPRGVSLGLMLDYLAVVSPGAGFIYKPIVNDDAWERYNRGEPRTLTLSIAAPQQIERLDGIPGSVLSVSKRLAEITQAPIVTVQVAMGHSKGSLFKDAVDQIIQRFSSEGEESGVRDLSVRSKADGLPADEIDFLRDLARDQETLELSSDDHDTNLQTRWSFIERSFAPRLDTLREMYG